ncbi:pyrophosphatase [Mycobacterium phage Indlulamithi]|uniref:MazG-like nucleotide pyrophosphohydrolase n=1 Tax=Mycobacterium phage Indlulamithi TaxID=2656582 RepID=A0A649VCP3_9CAUD|nr:pyrophosphatase [Mycobacterium phage Indlulamithi]QGJ90111.1 MazG-like nucleotide pyrophosphohydrolase [Mycobacterium phage Indlulamithi]
MTETGQRMYFGDANRISIPTPENQVPQPNHDPFHGWVTMDGRFTEQASFVIEWALKVLAKGCFVNSKAHGWYEPYMQQATVDGDTVNVLGQRNFGEVMALITSEVSEAFEEFRNGDDQTRIYYKAKRPDGSEWKWEGPQQLTDNETGEQTLGKPEGIAAELADVLIRVLDYVGAYGIPISDAVLQKHHYNQTRPYRHGGKLA